MSRFVKVRTALRSFALILCFGLALNSSAQTATTTSLTATPQTPNPSVVGQPVQFTATVDDPGTTGNTIDGYVEFFDNGVWIGVAQITPNTVTATAVLTYARLAQGTHSSIFATYQGNASFSPSSSLAATSQVVNTRSTSTTISSLVPTSVNFGQPSVVNVTVQDTAGVPAGTRGAFTATTGNPPAVTGHAQSLLPDGTVLLLGGTDTSATVVFNAQIYTPSTGLFAASTMTGTLTARTGATATLLQNGKVLIVGGSSDGTPANVITSKAELYDPVTNTIAVLPNASGAQALNTARMNHTATLLDDGTVLIAGGVDSSGTTLDTTELFTVNGTSGAFANLSTGSASTKLIHPRAGHTATLLSGTRVLITGGDSGGNAEIYDASVPSSAAVAGSPATLQGGARSFHTATKLPDNRVLITGGTNGSTVLDSVEFYDPVADNFTSVLGTLSVARQGHRATLLPDGTVLITAGSNATTATGGQNSAATYNPPYDPQGAATIASDNGGAGPVDAVDQGTGSTACSTLRLTGDGAPICHGSVTPAAINTNPQHNISVSYADTVNVHTASSTSSPSPLTVLQPITVTASADTKTYDGTTNPSSPAVVPVLTGTLNGTDFFCGTQVFQSKNAAAGTAVTVPVTTFVIRDTNCSGTNHTANYSITFVNNTASTINQLALTVTAQTNTKPYDGTTSAATLPQVTAGSVQAGDTAAFIETYDTRNFGTAKTLTPSGVVNDGNGGANYTYTFANDTTGVINQLAINVTATTNTKTYDGTTSAAAIPTASALGTGDTVGFTEVYSDKNAGSGKTLIPSGKVNDSNGGNNYTYTYVNDTTGVIDQKAVTVTAVTNTKTYDGTNSAAAIPTNSALAPGDTASFTEAYSNRNAGSGKTLIPSGTVNDGNSGNNYSYTFVNDTTGVINKAAVTVTAVTNTKTYDGSTLAAAIPTNTALIGSDTPSFAEVYSDKNAGAGKTLSPSGVVNDGNGGANYAYTFVNNTTGVINQLALTVTAVTNTKTYDRTTSAAAIPTHGALATGDSPSFIEAYSDKVATTGKTLIPTGVVNDGNGGANYTYTFVNDTTGVINPLAITGSITANNKVYDATAAATIATRPLTGVIAGDTVTYTGGTATFSDQNVGVAKTVSATGLSLTGADAGNYTVNGSASTTADITKLAVTVTAATNSKTYDGTTLAAAIPANSALAGSDTPAFIEAYSNRNAGSGKTLVPSGTVNDGNGGGNYSYTFVNNATGIINQAAVTVTAVTNTKTYDATTAAAAIPTNTTLGTGDTPGFVEVYSDKNAAAGKTLVPSGVVNDGNGGANYAYTFVNDITGVINQLAITGSITASNKVFDATASASIGTRALAGAIAGDVVTYTGGLATFSDANIGAGKTVTAIGLSLTGTDALNYSVNSTATTTASITAQPLTVVADGSKSKTYGSVFGAFTSVVTGLRGSDAITVNYASTGAAATALVGAYDITVPSVAFTTGTATNYAITLTTATGGLVVNKAPLTVTANNIQKTAGLSYTFAGTEFTAAGLKNSDSVTSATLASAGTGSSAGAGPYPILISAPVGTGLSNYTITLVNGTLTVGAAPSQVAVDVQAVLSNGNGAFTFTATVTATQASGVSPQGAVTFTMDGAAGPFSTTPTALVSGKATVTGVVLPAGTHKVTATFNPSDANFVTSNQSAAVTVAASLRGTPIVPGTNTTVTASIAYPGAGSPTITLTGYSTTNPPPMNNVTCVVTSALGNVAGAPTCSVTNNFPVTLSPTSATAALTIKITTSTIVASLQPSPIPAQRRIRAIYAISLGMPAIVFMGLAVPLGTLRRKLRSRKVLGWLGLVVVITLLLAAVGCGGGFSNANNSQPVVTAGASTPGSYTAVLYYTDATGTHALASVDFAVGQ